MTTDPASKPKKTRSEKQKPKSRGNGEGSIYKRPDGRWSTQLTLGFDADGKQVRKTVYGKTRKEVADKLAELSFKAARANLKPSEITVRMWLSEYLESQQAGVKAATQRAHRRYFNLVDADLGDIKLQKLTAIVVQRYLTKLAGGYAAGTFKHVYHWLAAALKRAVKQGLLLQNPMDLVDVPSLQPERSAAQVWSRQEVQRFLSVNAEHLYLPLFYTLLTTGMRLGELLALEWGDWREGKLHIHSSMSLTGLTGGQRTKQSTKTTGSVRALHVPPDLAVALERQREQQQRWKARALDYWEGSDAMWTDLLGVVLTQAKVRGAFRKMIEQANIPQDGESERLIQVRTIRVHDLRHTYISLAINAGLDPKLVADRVGHADVAITLKVYRQVQDADRQRAGLSLQALLGAD